MGETSRDGAAMPVHCELRMQDIRLEVLIICRDNVACKDAHRG